MPSMCWGNILKVLFNLLKSEKINSNFVENVLKTLVKKFSEDSKNLSVEFNEFLKLVAHDKNDTFSLNCQELTEAFR